MIIYIFKYICKKLSKNKNVKNVNNNNNKNANDNLEMKICFFDDS